MAVSKVQLTGGAFQDPQGNVLANGYLKMVLSSDEEVNDSLICSGIEIIINLDENGNVVASPAQYVWGNDVMFPVNSYYRVTGYTTEGQIGFGPNNQQVVGGPTFDTGTWVPNSVISWVPSPQSVAFEVAGSPLSSQTVVDYVNTGNVTFADNGSGQISASVVIPPVPPVIPSLPQPDVARYAMWIPNSAFGGWEQVNDNQNTVGGNGTWNPPDAADGAYYSTGAFTSSNSPLGWNGTRQFWPGRLLNFKTTMKMSSLAAGGNLLIGLSEALCGNNVDPSTMDCLLFQMTGAGVLNLVVGTGGTNTAVPLGITAVSGTRYQLQLTLSAGVVNAYVNGLLAATCSTNVPTSNTMAINYWLKVSGGGTFTDITEYMYADTATP